MKVITNASILRYWNEGRTIQQAMLLAYVDALFQ